MNIEKGLEEECLTIGRSHDNNEVWWNLTQMALSFNARCQPKYVNNFVSEQEIM